MPRLDLQYRNRDIMHMLKALRAQAVLLSDSLSRLEIRMEMRPQEDQFNDTETRDQMTNLSLIAQNLAGEVTLVWKRTR